MDKKKKETCRIIVAIISVLFIIFIWVKKADTGFLHKIRHQFFSSNIVVNDKHQQCDNPAHREV